VSDAESAVVGVGNPLMGDDGVGAAVVEAVVDRRPPGTTAAHAGTTALMALEVMSGADSAAVVDAVRTDAAPGSIHQCPLRRGPGSDPAVAEDASGVDVAMHDFTFDQALRSASGAYDLPDRITLVGVVPERVEPGRGLSRTVARRVPALTAATLDAVDARPSGEPTREGSTDRTEVDRNP
jgi:hydrogenase maturation protease